MSKSLFRRLAIPIFALVALQLSACAKPTGDAFHDPAENVNRKTHGLNKKLDKALLRPAGNAYGAVIGPVGDEIINDFASNMSEPSTIVNQILQGRLLRATKSTIRFAVNSTIGIAGITNPSADFGMERDESDFGETLHVWGVGEGAYVELPFYGGSTARDTIGIIVDFATDPLNQVIPRKHKPFKTGVKLVELAGDRDEYGEIIDGVLYGTEDSYASQRLYYLQNRRFYLSGGEISDADLENPYDVE